jgi:DtxR family manganese transport transcriptional regulator
MSKVPNEMLDADQQAANFQRVREAHQTEVAEDYVELIADLIETTGEARATDIARRLGVTHPTVVKTIARLQRDGLVASQRHAVVVSFLRAIGVSAQTAERDAEGVEHHISEETLAAFKLVIQATSPD